MFSPKPFGKGNGCLVCGKETPDCRQNPDEPDFVMCHTYADARKGEKINGYVCVKESNGHTASFKPDNKAEQSEEQRQQWLENQRASQQRKQREREQFLQNLLSVEERDQQYRLITDRLFLNKYHHHTVLVRKRGLMNDEILFAYEQGWLRSWSPTKEIKGASQRLAGINPSDNTLTGVGGISIAATDGEGHIVGHQIAVDKRDRYGKYLWLSSQGKGGSSPHLPNGGELPLFIWRHPEATEITETWLVEGSLKSLIAALKLWFRLGQKNIQVIGAAGGNFKTSSKTFLQALQVQTTKVVRLLPDAGSLDNKQILSNYRAVINLAASNDFDVSVGWWNQYRKRKNDIDEIDEITFRAIDFISPVEFFELAVTPPSGVGFSKNNSQEQKTNNNSTDNSSENSELIPEESSKQWYWDKWLKRRRFTPDIVVNQSEFTFGDIPQSGVIAAGKSGLGTGKTNELIENIKEGEKRGKGAVIIGYRNNLLLQTGERAKASDIFIYHIHQDDEAKTMVADDSSHHMMCLDSIHHIDGYFKGRDIYLDETCSVILHAVCGGTLGSEQAKTLRIFSKALEDCDRVFALDGNLSDMFIDFIAKLAPQKRVIKIENKKQIPSHNITFIDGINDEGEIKKSDRSPLIQFLLYPEVKPWIFSDSKERTKILFKLLTDAGKKGVVLNSETTGEEWAKEFLANQNDFVKKDLPDFVILSPSGDSGLSCTLNGYFTHKISFFSGILGTNSQHQAMFRLRDNTIPHYVFCPEIAAITNRSTPKGYVTNNIDRVLEDRVLHSAFLASECADNPQEALRIMMEAITRQDPKWYGLSCEMMALDNIEMNNYRRCLIHALTEVGHNVTVEEWDTAVAVKELEKQTKVEVQKTHSKEVFASIEFDSIEEANKKGRSSPNKATQRKIEKTRLIDRLPGIKDSEVWSADFIYECHIKNRDFIRQQERYWLLKNYEVSQKRHESIWNHAALTEDFFSRRVSAMGHDVIWGLRELDLLQFTEGEQEYHKDSPEVIALVETLRSRNDIQLALRISQVEPETVEGKERLRILNNLLSHIGYKTQPTQRLRIQTDKGVIRARHYSITPTTLSASGRSTPPLSYIKPGGCGPNTNQSDGYGSDTEHNNDKGSSQFDLSAAREAILAAVEYKFTKWMDSDKSKVSWEVEVEEPTHVDEEVSSNTSSTGDEIEDFWNWARSWTPALADACKRGVDMVKNLLSPLSSEHRWAVMTSWQESQTEQFTQFETTVPHWYEWCNC